MEDKRIPRTLRLASYCSEREKEVSSLLHDADFDKDRPVRMPSLRRRVKAYRTRLQSRSRRKRCLKKWRGCERISHSRSFCNTPQDSTSRISTCRFLKTHRWYSKRFRMEFRWGIMLPFASRCRSASVPVRVLRSLHEHCVIHDAIYYRPLCVKDLPAVLELKLSQVSDPGIVARAFSQLRDTLSHQEHVIPIHRKGCYPQGFVAFSSVLFLSPASSSLPVSLLFWIHAAALKECSTQLKLALGDLTDLTVQRIDICGGTSLKVVERALSLDSNQLHLLRKGTAIFFNCKDPRICKGTPLDHLQHDPSNECLTQPDNEKSTVLEDSTIKRLFSLEGAYPLPFPDHVISSYNRTCKQLMMYSPCGTLDQAFVAIQNSLKNGKETMEECKEDATEDSPCRSFISCCLIAKETSGIPFYSLCVPSEWTLPFWLQLIQNGSRVAGINEWSAVQDRMSKPMQSEVLMDAITHNHESINGAVKTHGEFLYSKRQLNASIPLTSFRKYISLLRVQLVERGKCLVGAKTFVCIPIEGDVEEVSHCECGTIIHTFPPGVQGYPGGWGLCNVGLLSDVIQIPVYDIFHRTLEIATVIRNRESNALKRAIGKIEFADDFHVSWK